MIYGLKIIEVHFFQEGDIVSDLLSNGPWPLAAEEHLAIKYSFDQIKIGEFVRFCAGLPTNENLEVRIFKKFSLDVPNNLSLARLR